MRVKTWTVAACAGLGLGGVLAAQPAKTEPVRTEPTKGATAPAGGPPAAVPAPKVESLLTMVADAKAALGKARDYTCVFTRQELINGKLSPEQVGEMKVRHSPAGVYVRFARPEALAGMEVAYTGARQASKMKYRPAGIAGAKGFRTLDLDDKTFLSENRHPVTEWTMTAVLDRVSAAAAREKTLNNPVDVLTADYQYAGKNVTRYDVLTRRPHVLRYAYRMLIYVDKETKLPLRYEAYDEPKPGATAGDLFEMYSFSDVKTNAGIGENAFDQ